MAVFHRAGERCFFHCKWVFVHRFALFVMKDNPVNYKLLPILPTLFLNKPVQCPRSPNFPSHFFPHTFFKSLFFTLFFPLPPKISLAKSKKFNLTNLKEFLFDVV